MANPVEMKVASAQYAIDGFPSDGVLVTGRFDTPQWVYGLLELEQIRAVRTTGQVFNYQDWPKQLAIAAAGAAIVTLDDGDHYGAERSIPSEARP